jgi:hypothetical protein
MLCLTEHHLHLDVLASLHIDNYMLWAYYCRKTKHKGDVCMYIHNSTKFTILNIDNYSSDQDIEVCNIHLDSVYDKLWILAVYRSPLGNFSTFLTKFDLILNKILNVILTFLYVETLTLVTLWRAIKNQLDNILHSFNLSNISNFPTRIGPNSLQLLTKFS